MFQGPHVFDLKLPWHFIPVLVIRVTLQNKSAGRSGTIFPLELKLRGISTRTKKMKFIGAEKV